MWPRPILFLLMASTVAVAAGPAFAREPKDCVPLKPAVMSMMASFAGRCNRAVFLGEDKTGQCHGSVLNVAYNNGRVGFSFSMNPKIVVVLTGGKGGQTAEKMFRVEIDKMSVTRDGVVNQSVKSGVKGTCTLDTSNPESASIQCGVDAEGKSVALDFTSHGEPKIVRFCPPT